MSLLTTTVLLLLTVFTNSELQEPLILTPLIESGNIDKARSSAKVGSLKGGIDVESYSGYFTVDEEYDSHLFFWFFPAEIGSDSAPVLLWLQGGPGTSAMTGLFTENGPYVVNEHYELERRDIYWSQKYNVIYIDNPVGTGYSFTVSGTYARNQTSIADNLYSALIQFFIMFPELQTYSFFIAGESFAGKYVPVLGHTIHTRNYDAELKINLQGMSIGNGFCDPENMLLYGDYLYQIGLIDRNERDNFRKKESEIARLIRKEKWLNATQAYMSLIYDYTKSYFYQETGFSYQYNFLYPNSDPVDNLRFATYIVQEKVRNAIHVGNNNYYVSSDIVKNNLFEDYMKSVRPIMEQLLENYRMLIYNGQLDIIVAYPLTENYLYNFEWNAADEYKKAKRYQWNVDDILAGYVKTAGNLTEIMIRNAGHLVPGSQPSWGMDLIERFVENKPYH